MIANRVLIAGVGGASLGTEIAKCLSLAGKYEIFGCDISSTAYGLYDSLFSETFRISVDDYCAQVLSVCKRSRCAFLVPGGEHPNRLIGAAIDCFVKEGIQVVTNDAKSVALLTDKKATFEALKALNIPIPKTVELNSHKDVLNVGLPCIVKPSTGSGGSVSVFYATSADEAQIYGEYIRRGGGVPVVQEYISDLEGEFSIGVLSLPNKKVIGSVALRRTLEPKLSVLYRGRGGVVSSGYSQGYIDAFPDLCNQAESIALALGSRGPMNIQGRVRAGTLLPFEINPRFSASMYLRALSGFNDLDILLTYLSTGELPQTWTLRPGWYLRSLTETFVPREKLL